VHGAVRGALFFGIWLVLDQGMSPGNLVVGVLAASAATGLSLRLLPPASGHVRIIVLAGLLPRFLWQSLLAGLEVARRVFDPRLPLQPGFVDYPVGLPRGAARNAFELISSLLPGTVPTAEDATTIEYHCLDVSQPVTAQLAAEEAAYARALVPGQPHD
jgi:multicomponent Na+:H+ antiporter subunit E